jgi:hypothetical protein
MKTGALAQNNKCMDGVGTIHISEIAPTISALEINLGMKLIAIGSAGKREFSGDIDVAVAVNPSDMPAFMQAIKTCDIITEMKKSSLIMTKVKIVNYNDAIETDLHRTGFVQVDFMYTTDVDWATVYYHSPYELYSKYKGAYRNILLAIAAKNIRNIKINDFTTERYKLSPKDGLLRVRRIKGIKTDEVIGGPWKKIFDIADELEFGRWAKLESFENVWEAIDACCDAETTRAIAEEFAKDRNVIARGIPSEITDLI